MASAVNGGAAAVWQRCLLPSFRFLSTVGVKSTPAPHAHVAGKVAVKKVLDRLGIEDGQAQALFRRVAVLHRDPARFLDPTYNAKIQPALDHLDNLGMDTKEKRRVVLDFPKIFYLSTDIVLWKTNWFTEKLGMSQEEVKALVVGYPKVFDCSIKNKLRALLDIFLKGGFTSDDLREVLRRSPWSVSLSLEEVWEPILEAHARLGLPKEYQVVSIGKSPLLFSPDHIKHSTAKLKWLRDDVGIDKDVLYQKIVGRQSDHLHVANLNGMKEVHDYFKSQGYSCREILHMVTKDIRLFCAKLAVVKEKELFLRKVLGKRLNDPRHLRCNMDNKMLTRVASLRHRKVDTRACTLRMILSRNDEEFSMITAHARMQDFKEYAAWFGGISKEEKLERIQSNRCSPEHDSG